MVPPRQAAPRRPAVSQLVVRTELAATIPKVALPKVAAVLAEGCTPVAPVPLAAAGRTVAVAPTTVPTAAVEPTAGAALAAERAPAEPSGLAGVIERSDQE